MLIKPIFTRRQKEGQGRAAFLDLLKFIVLKEWLDVVKVISEKCLFVKRSLLNLYSPSGVLIFKFTVSFIFSIGRGLSGFVMRYINIHEQVKVEKDYPLWFSLFTMPCSVSHGRVLSLSYLVFAMMSLLSECLITS